MAFVKPDSLSQDQLIPWWIYEKLITKGMAPKREKPLYLNTDKEIWWAIYEALDGFIAGSGSYTPSQPGNWPTIVPTTIVGALDDLARRKTTQVLLASLDPSGVWFPLQYVGPTCGTQSSPSFTGYGTGVGFCQIPNDGELSNFRFTNATPSASDFTNVQLYLAPNGNPSLFSFTGVTLSILTGAYISVNSVDTLTVNAGDIIVCYNADPVIGYTPDAMTITADFVGF